MKEFVLVIIVQNLQDILKVLCGLQSSSASLVSWIALLVSFCSLGVTIFNSVKTLKDKKFENVTNSITDFLSLFGSNMNNQKWQLLKSGKYISDEHQKLEIKITGYLKNWGKDKPLRQAVLQIRNENPIDEDELIPLKYNIELKLKEWRNNGD